MAVRTDKRYCQGRRGIAEAGLNIQFSFQETAVGRDFPTASGIPFGRQRGSPLAPQPSAGLQEKPLRSGRSVLGGDFALPPTVMDRKDTADSSHFSWRPWWSVGSGDSTLSRGVPRR